MSKRSSTDGSQDFVSGFKIKNPILRDAISGSAAGVLTGIPVSYFEAIKVWLQTRETPLNFQEKESFKVLWKERYSFLKPIPQFSLLFGGVCATEFTINSRIDDAYSPCFRAYFGPSFGGVPGITASAISGATFLTVADQIIYRQHLGESVLGAVKDLTKIRPTALFTGWVPMVGREAVFVFSVMQLGPRVGQLLKEMRQSESQVENIYSNLAWSYTGRLISGIFTTALSQPFDVYAREMMKAVKVDPTTRPSLLKTMQKTSLQTLKVGMIVRLVLSTWGGATAGTLYQFFKEVMMSEDQDPPPRSSSGEGRLAFLNGKSSILLAPKETGQDLDLVSVKLRP